MTCLQARENRMMQRDLTLFMRNTLLFRETAINAHESFGNLRPLFVQNVDLPVMRNAKILAKLPAERLTCNPFLDLSSCWSSTSFIHIFMKQKGVIRIRYKYTEEFVLPLPSYSKLLEVTPFHLDGIQENEGKEKRKRGKRKEERKEKTQYFSLSQRSLCMIIWSLSQCMEKSLKREMKLQKPWPVSWNIWIKRFLLWMLYKVFFFFFFPGY